MRKIFGFTLSAAFCLAGASEALPAKVAAEAHPGQRAFARELAREARKLRPDLDRRAIERTLAGAQYQQSIIDAVTKPAESKPWRDYRPIFLTDKRVADGVAFYRDNAAVLEPIARHYGVPAELIVAIVGVETNYGRITGRYRVLDALVTLAFYYPQRAPFFRGELKQLLLLPDGTFPYALGELKGSYAGAMGWGQFMPTSYAKYAQDHDRDGHIDLWNSRGDIFASIANYFIGYGWQPGQPVAHAAQRDASARALAPAGFEPVYSIAQLGEWGYRCDATLDPELLATLVRLDGAAGDEYWITHQNFFVITRYNRSPLYSLAVFQLAQAIAAGVAAAPGP